MMRSALFQPSKYDVEFEVNTPSTVGRTMRFGVPISVSVPTFIRSRIGKNIIANYAGSLVNVAVPIIVLPFLLRALGRENWGLVSFATLMVTLMAVLNAGMAQSLVKEFGSRWSGGDAGREAAGRLLFGYERIYWIAASSISVIAATFVNIIVSRWMNVGTTNHSIASGTVFCAIALFFVHLPAALYSAVLTSLQEQVTQNSVRAGFTLAKGVGGVLVANQTQSVLAYLCFLILAVLAETMTLAHKAWRLMPRPRRNLSWDIIEVRSGLRFSATLSALVVLGALTTQIDKFYVSVKLPIVQLGVYSISYSLAMGLLQISYPIFTAILPRLVEIGSDQTSRNQINARLLKLAAVGILAIGCVYAALGRNLLQLWLGDEVTATQVAVVLDWLLLANALNIVYNIGYTNWISLGETRWLACINVVSFIIALLIAPLFIDKFGLLGAAFSLVTINVIGSISAVTWLFQNRQKQGSSVS
jgi:O-antigen/teichoic acid export membrane protein